MMNAPPNSTCPSCGASGAGNFCASCGSPRVPTPCGACGRPLDTSAKFCSSCGQPTAASGGRTPARTTRSDRTPWILAAAALAGLLAVLLLMLVRTAPRVTAAAADSPVAGDEAGIPPDISSMSPRERFNRLYNKVMTAAQTGDEGTVGRFTPMALTAYAQLDTVDADARYHAALIEVHTGDVAGPAALADTILAQDPGHLFGYVIRGTVARWEKDDKALARAQAGFLEHYDAEMKAARQEYSEHTRSLDEFRQAALKAGGR